MTESERAMRKAAVERLQNMLKNPLYKPLCTEDIIRAIIGDDKWGNSTTEDDANTIIALLSDDKPSHDINWLDNVPQDSNGVLWLNGGVLSGDAITAPLTLDNDIRLKTVRTVTQRENDLIDLLKDAAVDYCVVSASADKWHRRCNEFKEEYIVLPKDADGIPIRVGDVMKNMFGDEHFTVLGIGYDGCEDVLFCEDDDLNYQCYSVTACVHYKEPTIRDIVEELVSEAYSNGWTDGSDDTFSYDTAELVREYTDRLESL